MLTTGLQMPDWLEQRAFSDPDHPAIIDGRNECSFAELAERVRSRAEHLAQLGVARGDRVAVLLRNGVEFVETMHALGRIGAVLVPLDRRLAPPEIAPRLAACDAAFLLHDGANGEPLPDIDGARYRSIPIEAEAHDSCRMTHDQPPGRPARDAGAPVRAIDLSAVHSILFTSGSSGRAKGVQLTYGNFLWSAVGSAFNLGVHDDDRWLACLPFCHVGGLSILLRGVVYGMTVVIHDSFDPLRVNDAIDGQRVTIVSVVANMLRRMLDARGSRPYPPWLRCVLLGGGPAPRSLLEDCAARAVPVVQTYGMTEAASQIATLPPRDALRKLGSAGKPLLGTEVKVEVAAGAAREEIGEILVRGPTLSPGYVNGEPSITDGQGWFHTGDLGRLDEQGFLYVVGRADDMFISGGENIHPAEIETVLQSHPAVAEVVVRAAADPAWGAVPVAEVRLSASAMATPEELEIHARQHLAGFKVPRRIRIVTDFPRTASGKIRRILPHKEGSA